MNYVIIMMLEMFNFVIMKKFIFVLFLVVFFPFLVRGGDEKDVQFYKILLKIENLRKSEDSSDVLIAKYDSLLQVVQEHGYDSLAAVIYNDQGIIFYQMGSYSNALDCFVRALEFYEKNNDIAGMGRLYNNLGVISFQAKNYKQALDFFSRSFEIYSRIKDTASVVNIINNVGSVFERLKQFNKALLYHRLALRIAVKNKLYNSIYSSLNNMGVVFENTGRLDSALKYYLKAMQYSPYISDVEYGLTLNNVGRIMLFSERVDEAKPYLDSALYYSRLYDAKDNLLESYRLLSMYFEKKKDYSQAYHYLKLFKDLVIKVDSQKVEGKFETFLFQRNQKNFEKEKQLLANQLKLQRKLQLYIVAIILMIILVLIFAINNIRQRNKILAEKNRIAELEKQNMEEKLQAQEKLANLEKEKMKIELEQKERQIAIFAMQMASKNDILKEIEKQALELYNAVPKQKQQQLNKLISYIHLNADDKDTWQNYVYHFEKVYPAFFSKLSELFPQLNTTDQRFCSYIFINLTNKEIAHIMGISESSVKIRKNRMAKKLNLSSAQNLSEFLREKLRDVIPQQ